LLIEPTQPQIHRPSEFFNLKAFGSGFKRFWHVNSGNFCHGLGPPARSLPGLVNEPVEAVSLPKKSQTEIQKSLVVEKNGRSEWI